MPTLEPSLAPPDAPPVLPVGEPARSLRHSVIDGSAHAFMVGAGETYITPFAVALGAGTLVVGLLGSLPHLAFAITQLVALAFLDRAATRRRVVVPVCWGQAAAWIPFVVLALVAPSAVTRWLVLPAATAYWILGAAPVPGWSSWMGDLVPAATRGDWFGRRERWRAVAQLAGALAAGGVLEWGTHLGHEGAAFAAIFAAAGVARAYSAWHVDRMIEPPYRPAPPTDAFTFRQFLRRAPGNNFGRYVLLVGAFHAAINVSAPFVVLYLQRDLEFPYVALTAALTVPVLAQTATFVAWGRVGDRYGNRLVVLATGLGMAVVPLGWLVSTGLAWVLALQTVAGFVAAGFVLAMSNFIFDAVTPAQRGRCMAYFFSCVYGGVCVGALAGTGLAEVLKSPGPWTDVLVATGLGTWLRAEAGTPAAFSPILAMFVVSVALRFAVLGWLWRAVREVRPVAPFRPWHALVHAIGASPARGPLDAPSEPDPPAPPVGPA